MISSIVFPSLAVSPTRVYPYVSDAVKGRGYYSTGGMHAAQVSTSNGFIGSVKLQATLAAKPTETDWFDVDGSVVGDGATAVPDQALIINFKGNFVWVRAVITQFTAGDLNRVLFQI